MLNNKPKEKVEKTFKGFAEGRSRWVIIKLFGKKLRTL
jgi:hypothetical protein